jgi:hypothetical protein
MDNEIIKGLREIQKKFPGKTLAESYLKSRLFTYKNLARDYPTIWKYVFAKRYILPNYRQADYVSQEACDYLLLDSFFGYLEHRMDLKDHVLAHCMNNFIAAMNYGRPTFFLERELGEPLLRTKLPMDYTGSDIHWRWPAMRVYIPKGLVCLVRNGQPNNVMFLDIAYVPKGKLMRIPEAINKELQTSPFTGRIPMLDSEFEGMSVTTFLDFDCPESVVGYAASSKLETQSIKEIMDQTHYELASGTKSDELDTNFQDRILALAINILIFLSSMPIEYESAAIRKARLEGKHLQTGLFPAKFVGQCQIRATKKADAHIANIPTGKTTASHWAAGHWKRQPIGPGRKDRKLIWILSYATGEYRKV